MRFAQVVFQAPQVGLLFGRFSLGPPYAKSAKMADLGGFARFTITRLCGQFWRRRLRRNVVRCLHFKRILMKISCDLSRLFSGPSSRPSFWAVFPWSPYAKSAKMADLGGFARFTITRLCGQFWRRRLRQNVVRCLHFKRILMKISCDLRRLFFRPLKSAFFLGGFPLVPLCKICENGRFGWLC